MCVVQNNRHTCATFRHQRVNGRLRTAYTHARVNSVSLSTELVEASGTNMISNESEQRGPWRRISAMRTKWFFAIYRGDLAQCLSRIYGNSDVPCIARAFEPAACRNDRVEAEYVFDPSMERQTIQTAVCVRALSKVYRQSIIWQPVRLIAARPSASIHCVLLFVL